jgi:hypothetical protein
VLEHEAFHIVQLSIQGSHVHLLVEAANREALSLGMKAFEISAAKHINAAMSREGSWWERRTGRVVGQRRKGRVFADRYHEERITTPAQARNALAYVLTIGASTVKIVGSVPARGRSIHTRRGGPSTVGRNARANRSCGGSPPSTSRFRCGFRERGSCGLAGDGMA